MKRWYLVLCVLLAVGVTAQANLVPNGDFQTMLKPGEPTVTATVNDGCYWSIPGTNIKGPAGEIATYSDGTTGDYVETPGWVAVDGTNSDCMQGSQWGGPDGAGDVAFLAFGGWGGPTTIETADPLSLSAGAYTLSADVYNHGGPVVLELITGGSVVTPDTESTPTLVEGQWVEFTRSYSSIPAGDYKVLVGTRGGPPWTGNRVSVDNVTLIPEPATMLLLGLGGLGLIRRKK